jgi:DNA polymerase V
MSKHTQTIHTPLFSNVSAGFPTPATDYIDKKLSLDEYLIRHPASTFFVRADGDSMIGTGIQNRDLLVVDRSLQPRAQDIVIAIIDGEFTVKRVLLKQGKLFLKPGNPKYQLIEITEDTDFLIWGVVTNVIKQFR